MSSMKREIIIGAAGPLSGTHAKYGAQIRYAVEYSIAEANRRGGALSRPLRIELIDDMGAVNKAEVGVRKIAEIGAAAVIGHYLSDCALAAQPTYANAGVLQIAPSTTTPTFTDIAANRGWATVFRTCGRDDKQGAAAASYIAEKWKGARIAILHHGLPYGTCLAEVIRSKLRARDITETIYSSLGTSALEHSTIVAQLLDDRIEFVYVGGYYTDVGPFLHTARAAGFHGGVMSGGANANQGLYTLAGDASDGLLITCRPDARLSPAARGAVETLRSGGFEPEGYTLSAVAAVEIWVSAVNAAGSTEARKVADAMREMTFDTTYGKLSFDSRGDVVDPNYAIHRWKNGKYAELCV